MGRTRSHSQQRAWASRVNERFAAARYSAGCGAVSEPAAEALDRFRLVARTVMGGNIPLRRAALEETGILQRKRAILDRGAVRTHALAPGAHPRRAGQSHATAGGDGAHRHERLTAVMRARAFDPRTGALVLVAGVAATSWAAIFVRLADEAPALSIAAYRMLFATAVLTLLAAIAIARGGDRLPARSTLPWLALSGLFLAGHFWSWFASLERTSVGSSVVIVGTQPLLAAMLGYFFLGERPRRAEYYGIGLALAGLLIIGGRDFVADPGELSGDLLALLGGLLGASYRTVGRSLRGGMSAAVYSATVYGVATVALWALVLGVRPQVGGFADDTWTYLVLIALVPQVIGHTAFNWALAHYRVVTVGIVALGEPVFATLLAIPVLSEAPTAGVIVGGPLIIAGVFVGLRGSGPSAARVMGQTAKPWHPV